MPPSDESSPSSPFMNELINIFYLQKYFFLVNCVFCFTPFCIFKYLIPKPTVLTKKNKVLTSLCKKEGKKINKNKKNSWCISWLSFVRQEVSIDALSWAPRLPLWSPSLVFWFGCQYSSRSFLHGRVWLSSSSLYFFFFNSPFECVC